VKPHGATDLDLPRLLVKDCMNRDLKTVKYGETVETAVKEIIVQRIGSVLVSKEGEIIGIITESDIVNRVLGQNLNPAEVTVQEVMSSPLEMISENVPLDEAAERMREKRIKKLLVVKGSRPVGILTIADLTKKTAAVQKERFDGWARNVFDAWNAF
jgi:CBS domain-containing protein